MSDQRSVINALIDAIKNNPRDVSLRVHVSSLLLAENDADGAWEHIRAALEEAPDNLEALALAARTAELQGRTRQASAYRRIADALQTPQRKSATENQTDELLFEYDDSIVNPDALTNVLECDQRLDTVLESTDEIWTFEDPGFRLDDVAGMDEVKQRLELAFLAPMKNPKLKDYFGKSLRGGLLL